MLDNLNNRFLAYLENKNWKLATVYWRLVGKYIH